MFASSPATSRAIAAPIAAIALDDPPNGLFADDRKTGAFIAWKLVNDLCQMADDSEAAYALTNFADTLLKSALDREINLTEAQAQHVIGAIALASAVVSDRMAIDPVTVEEGMEAAARMVRRRWIDGDQPGSRTKGRWPHQARLKIMRNAAHSIALRRELMEQAGGSAFG